MTHGKIKTPKSILFPYAIKSLTNNTELINITHKYVHGISYNSGALDTEYAFFQLNRREETCGVVLPEGCKERELAIVVRTTLTKTKKLYQVCNLNTLSEESVAVN